MRGLIVFVLLVAGCGGGDDALIFASGQRLRARVVAGEDGSRFLRGWVDTELGFDCELAEAGGRLRCLPPDALRLEQFADAACTVPAIGIGPGGPPALVYERTAGAECWGSARRYYQASDVRVGPIYGVSLEGDCLESWPDGRYVVAGAPADLTGFVELTEEHLPGDDGLDVRLVRSADGAWWVAGAQDRGGLGALVPELSGTRPIWRPAQVARSWSSFSDDSCAVQVAETADLCEPPKAILVDASDDACEGYALRSLGAAHTPGETLYWVGGGTCQPRPWPATMAYEVGPPLATPELRRASVGAGRLRADAVWIGAGHALALGSIIDTRFDASCTPWGAADGRLRCLPEGGTAAYFTDEACQDRVALLGAIPACELEPPATAIAPLDNGERRRVFWIEGEPRPAGILYRMMINGCTAVDVSGGLYARLGDEIPPGDFVAVDERLE